MTTVPNVEHNTLVVIRISGGRLRLATPHNNYKVVTMTPMPYVENSIVAVMHTLAGTRKAHIKHKNANGDSS